MRLDPQHAPSTVGRAAGRRLAALAVVAILAGACGDPNGTPTPAPSAVPTPSPSPVDVSDDFVRIIAAPDFSATADITGTVSFGAAAGEITGDAVFSGADSSLSMRIASGGVTQETDVIGIGSQGWSRSSPGPWLQDGDLGRSRGSLPGTLGAIASVEDLGVVAKNGQQLHHLQPNGGGEISPGTIGFGVEGATDLAFTMDYYATDDGTPAILGINGTWMQADGSVIVPVELDIEFAMRGVGTPQTISPPEDVWVVNASKAFEYTMAHPADWTVESSATEDAYAIDGQPYVYVAPQQLAKGATLEDFVSDLQAFYKDDFGEPVSQVTGELDGRPAHRLVYQFTNDQGQDVTFVDEVAVQGRTGWEVFLVTAGGASDIPVFDQFVATFDFTD